MKRFSWHIAGAALVLALLLLLSGCGQSAPVEGADTPQPQDTASPNAGIASLTLPAATVDELAQIEAYPDLRELDLSGSSIPTAQIAAWAEAHPEIRVKYSVLLGSERIAPDAEELTAPAGTDYETLTEALQYLPALKRLSLPDTALNAEQLAALREKYSIDYSVELLGRRVDAATEEIDLSALAPDQVDSVAAVLSALPNLRRIELTDASGNSLLSSGEVKKLMDAAPQAEINYSFELFGKQISTADKRIEFVRQEIGDAGEAELRAALDLMPAGTYVLLDSCGFSNEVMASIRDDYPEDKVVWRIFCTQWFNALTDDEILLMTFDLNNENCGPLQYCTEARYIDVGHNNTLTDISWVRNMPKLECIIVSGAPVSDVSVFENCPNLTWLELCFCYYVKDLTPLAGLQNLRFLNVSFSQVEDISPLENLPLERFNCMKYDGQEISREQRDAFTAAHPDCIALFEGTQPYGYGWRYDDEGYTYFSYYARMRQIFHYADPNWYGGWKFDVVDDPVA
ncbi:MAG: hypothetical protein IJ705_09975 [Oscillospiraceae bacterium]|nr:hypothetical protein [Oscillospiraceae bacterium]